MNGEINIIIGSKKQFKIDFTNLFFARQFLGNRISTIDIEVPSGIPDQPFSKQVTIQGAINRSREVLKRKPEGHFGVGIEGGIFQEEGETYVFEAAAISINMGGPYSEFGISNLFRLPHEITELLSQNIQLSYATQQYLHNKDIDIPIEDIQKNGSQYYLSEEQITRESMIQKALQEAMGKIDKGLEPKTD